MLCQPSLIEPLGQALLEAMACGRSVVATRIGGPPEFVPPEAGVLVDPLDVEALAAALAARGSVSAAERGRARGRSRARRPPSGGADRGDPQAGGGAVRQVGEPDLDERPDRLLEPRLPRHLERLLPALARLLRARRPASAGCRP